MKYGRSLQELAIELDRQAKVKKDYVATAGAMQMTAVNENFDLVIGNTPFQLNENAHRQLGLQLKIPAPYYERMRAENPGLLMANVNGWFQQSPDTRRMVRTLDGTARAILSDRYRRIDNYEVAQTVLPIISEMQGARIESCELTDPDQPVLAIRAAFPLTAERFKCGNHAVVADFRLNREPLTIIVVLDLTDGNVIFDGGLGVCPLVVQPFGQTLEGSANIGNFHGLLLYHS